VALVSTAALVGCALALLGFTLWPDFFGRGRVWPLYVVVFLSGIARSFLRPASTALSAELIPREQFANAVAWRSSTWQFAAVVGPAAGGLIFGLAGPAAGDAADVVLMAISGLAIVLIAHAAAPLPDDKLPIGESLKIGVRFVFREPVILGAMTLDLFSVLFGGPVALLPIFADILHVGPEGLGMLRAAPAVGSVVMGLWLAHRRPLSRAGRTLFVSVTIFGLCMIGFGLSTSFLVSLLLLTLSGAADNVSVVIRSTMVQTMTPENMLGRVAAVNQIFIGSSNQIGEFESGVAARLMGTIPSVVFGGVMTLVVVALTAWRVPQLRRLERIADTALPSS